MKLDLNVYSFGILVSIYQVCMCYYVSNSTSTWINKKDKCDVATPNILYDNKKLTINTTELTIRQDVWVGYYQQTEYFEYIGCTRSERFENATTQLGVPTPGLCYSICYPTPYIGIEGGSKCHCIHTKPVGNLTEQGCTADCNVETKTACGGDNFISIYRILRHDDFNSVPGMDEDKCLLINVNKTKNKHIDYEWIDCEKPIYVFCISEQEQKIKLHKEKNIWKTATTLCYEHDSFPIGIKDIPKLSFNNKFAWAGIVRSNVIYSGNENRNSSKGTSYGYLKHNISSNNIVLQFTKEDIEKHIFCNAMTQTYQQSTTKRPKMIMPTSIASKGIHVTVVTMPVTLPDQKQKTNNGTSTKGTDVTIVVISVIAALLIVVIVISVILIKRKKIHCFTGKKFSDSADRKNTKNIKHVSHVNRSYDLVDIECIDAADKPIGNTYEDTYNMPAEVTDEKTTYEDTYNLPVHVPDAKTTYEDTYIMPAQVTNEKSTYETTYDTANNDHEIDEDNTSETTYNITGIDRETAKIKPDNIYNRLQPENNAIYDHTLNKSKNERQTSNDTYNTTEEVSIISTKSGISGTIDTTLESSLYNHTDYDLCKSKKTDHVYNTFNIQ